MTIVTSKPNASIKDPLTSSVKRQVIEIGQPSEPLGDHFSEMLKKIPRFFRPAKHPKFVHADVVFNGGIIPPVPEMTLYRIPDGWTSLYVSGIDFPGFPKTKVQPAWYLGGGTKTIRKLHIVGKSLCLNIRIPPWNCKTILGIHGKTIPDEPIDPLSIGFNLPCGKILQDLIQQKSLTDALDVFEELLAKYLPHQEIEGKTNVRHAELLSDAAFHAGERKGELSVEELANALNVSSRYLRKVWNEQAPISLSNYLDTLRFWHALEIITDPRRHFDLTHIAAMVGFADQSHMVKQFRRHLGISPRKLRESLGKSVYIHGGIVITKDGVVMAGERE